MSLQPDTPRPAVIASAFDKSVKWAGGLAVLFGTLSDVLKPLAPFTAYIAFAAAIATVVIIIALMLRLLLLERGMPALIFSLCITIISGGFYLLQEATRADNGVLARFVPGVETAQRTVGLISKRVDALEKKAEQAAGDIRDLQQRFDALGTHGGPVASPSKPEEFYRNARLREQSGDVAGARADYLAFFRTKVEAIDPTLRYAALVSQTSGTDAALKALDEAKAFGPVRSLDLARAATVPQPARYQALTDLLLANRDLLPAYYLRAQTRGPQAAAAQTLADKRQELSDLSAFLAGSDDGRIARQFIDQTLARQWIDSAGTRLAALRSMGDALHQQPGVMLTPMPEGWMALISLPEPALSLSWKRPGMTAFVEADRLPINDPMLGQPIPNSNLLITDAAWPHALSVSYRDGHGVSQGPFDLLLDNAMAVKAIRQTAELASGSWAKILPTEPDRPMLFNGAALFTCGLERALYGINGAPPTLPLALPPCDMRRPLAASGGDGLMVPLPPGTQSVTMQVFYKDGTASSVREFRR